MLSVVGEAFAMILNPNVLLVWAIGAVVGLVFGIIPGMSGTNAMAILLPVTFVMDQTQAVMFLIAILGAAGFSGSVTSILLNLPGEPTNAATLLDGYPLARQGKAGMAIAASATASALGALVGLVLLGLSIPILRGLILYFGPPELFAFAVVGVLLIGTATGDQAIKGLVAGAFGLVVGSIGYNEITGEVRFTGGNLEFFDGIPIIAAVIGLFAIPEMYMLMRSNRSVAEQGELLQDGIRQGIRETFRRPGLVLRSGLIGTAVGVVPGVGGTMAQWVAYYVAKRTSKEPETFGKGNIEGVIGPDASLNAKEGGSMMPVLALGVPGGLGTAILLSGFLLHGVTPGQRLFEQQQSLIWAMIIVLALVNVGTSALGLLITRQLIKLTLLPVRYLVPVVLVFAVLGAYVERTSFLSILVAVAMGLLGIVMIRMAYPRAPLLIGMILFPIVERNFHVSLEIYLGSYSFLLEPIVIAVWASAGLALILPRLWKRLRERLSHEVATEGGRDAALDESTPTSTAGEAVDVEPLQHDSEGPVVSTLADTIGIIAILVIDVLLIAQSFTYSHRARLLPLIVFVTIFLLGSWLLWASIRRLAAERSSRDSSPLSRHPDEPQAGRTTGTTGDSLGCSVVAALAWIVALPMLIWMVGAITAVVLYIAVFAVAYEGKRAKPRTVAVGVVLAVAVAALSLYAFEIFLAVQLPEGRLFNIIYY